MKASAKFVTYVPLLAIAAILIALRNQAWDAMRWTGLVLAGIGFSLLTAARIELGNSFSVTPQARKLVTGGIYSRIRHPIYVFSSIGLAGLSLYVHLPILLALLVPLVVMQLLRARAEDKLLHEHFGKAWEEYRKGTWM